VPRRSGVQYICKRVPFFRGLFPIGERGCKANVDHRTKPNKEVAETQQKCTAHKKHAEKHARNTQKLLPFAAARGHAPEPVSWLLISGFVAFDESSHDLTLRVFRQLCLPFLLVHVTAAVPPPRWSTARRPCISRCCCCCCCCCAAQIRGCFVVCLYTRAFCFFSPLDGWVISLTLRLCASPFAACRVACCFRRPLQRASCETRSTACRPRRQANVLLFRSWLLLASVHPLQVRVEVTLEVCNCYMLGTLLNVATKSQTS
jgi:hypothetical protein